MIRVLFVSLLLLVPGCGNHLTPAEACELTIGHAEDCGTYVPGGFGGTDRASDLARCTSGVEVLNERCQNLFSDIARCYSQSCTPPDSCRAMLEQLTMTCSP